MDSSINVIAVNWKLMGMKKQSASTIKLYEMKEKLDKRQTIAAIKKALISLGLRYVSEKDSNK